MKILMTVDAACGGLDYAVGLSHGLSGFDVEVVLATMGRSLSQEERMKINLLDNVSLYESCYRTEWMHNSWIDLKLAAEWLLKITALTGPDVIHLNNYVHGDLPWDRPVMVVCHSCVYSWWSSVRNSVPPAEWSYYRKRVSGALRRTDCIVSTTETMLHALERFYGAPGLGKYGFAARTEVIPNGCSPAKYSAEKKTPVIFSVGRLWDEAANMSILETAAKGLPWPVFVAGENGSPEQGVKQLDFKAVKYLGPLTEDAMAEEFAKSSIYAHPARYESFGLSILKAALSGCALVLGDIPSLREVWGSNAVYVDPEAPEALQAALLKLIEHPKLRLWYAERARQHAKRYMIERMAAAYEVTYVNMLKGQFQKRLNVL